MIALPADLTNHHDRLRWNAKYSANDPSFAANPLVTKALSAGLPAGPVLELACGRSGNALALAEAGRPVVAVDISDFALNQLAAEAARRGLSDRIDCVIADVPTYPTGDRRFAFVLATCYWDPAAFHAGCAAVMPGGLLGWQALAVPAGTRRQWHVRHGELSSLLPAGFTVLSEREQREGDRHSSILLARRS